MKLPMMNEMHPSKGLTMKSSHLLLGLAGVGLTLALIGCEGSATQTTKDDSLHGTLVDAAGNPLPEVEVSAYVAGASGTPTGNQAVGRTLTDAQGHYSFDELDANTYNLFAKQVKGPKGLFIPEVVYAASELDLGTDTLLAPGSIAGQVFVDDEPASEIFCYIPGSPLAAITDSSGRCVLPNIPPGVYAMKYTGHDVESRIDSGIIVQSNQVTELEPVSLFYDSRLQPAVPRGLAAEQLAANPELISLKWNRSASNDVRRYVIEMRYFPMSNPNSPYLFKNVFLENADTSFLDDKAYTLFTTADEYRFEDSAIAEYTVMAIDSMGNRSRKFSDPIRVTYVKEPWIDVNIELRTANWSADSIHCGDTLGFVARFVNPDLNEGFITWGIDSTAQKWFEGTLFHGKVTGDYGQTQTPDTLFWWPGKGAEVKPEWSIDRLKDTLWFYAGLQIQKGTRFLGKDATLEIRRDSTGCYHVVR